MFRSTQKNHVCQLPFLMGVNLQKIVSLKVNEISSCMLKNVFHPTTPHGWGDNGQICLLEIEWNIHMWTESYVHKNPIPIGWRGMGINFQKHHSARNWMTYPDMHRNVSLAIPTSHVVEQCQFTKIICLLQIEWKISIHNTYGHQFPLLMRMGEWVN